MICRALPMLALLLLSSCAREGQPKEADEPKAEGIFPRFEMQEIEKDLGVGYAVLLVDVNGDGKPDIVVVDQKRVVWYENPTWKRRVIIENQTKPDNVCIAAYDIDGDGQVDFALGADWRPFDTKSGGTIQWLKRGKTLDEKWTVYPIGEAPTVHRMRFDIVGDLDKPKLVVVPLMGKNATKEANWMDGEPVRILAYKIPNDPTKDRWVPEVIDTNLHVVHNFQVFQMLGPGVGFKAASILTASYEGLTSWDTSGNGDWKPRLLHEGNQANPKGSRGASEIKVGGLASGVGFAATIEPWHGHQVVVYKETIGKDGKYERQVIDESLKWGHALWWADIDGDGNQELIVGVRDDKSDKPGERRGVRLYKALDDEGTKWARHVLDDGGIAVEDLAAADLDGDGRIDIVAVGRQTHNIRIYWNRTGKPIKERDNR
jgi:hypothetical protein